MYDEQSPAYDPDRRNFLKGAMAVAATAGLTACAGRIGPMPQDIPGAHSITVDCSPNPLDLRPAVKAIMQAKNWILDRIPDNRPLVILMGETHDQDAHSLLQLATLKTLNLPQLDRAYRRVALGIELPHNILQNRFWDADVRISKKDLTAMDPDGQMALDTYVALGPWIASDFGADRFVYEYCLENHISASFNDTSKVRNKRGDIILDQDDAFTRSMIYRHKRGLIGTEIDGTSAAGVAIRNQAIVQNAADHINRTGAGFYVQTCGVAHVYGWPRYGFLGYHAGFKYEESLSVLFRQRGCAVLTVLPDLEPHVHDVYAQALKDGESVAPMVNVNNLSKNEDKLGEDHFMLMMDLESGFLLKGP